MFVFDGASHKTFEQSEDGMQSKTFEKSEDKEANFSLLHTPNSLHSFVLLHELCVRIFSTSGRKVFWEWVNEGVFKIVVEGCENNGISIRGNRENCSIVSENTKYMETLNNNEFTVIRYLEVVGVSQRAENPIVLTPLMD